MTRPFLADVLLFASAAAPAGAKTIHMPGDYPEIQMGINRARGREKGCCALR